MLRIRDSIDLKRLENFGFYESVTTRDGWDKTISIEGFNVYNMKIKYDRTILIYVELFNGKPLTNLDILFDLIQAGLVEKVVEE